MHAKVKKTLLISVKGHSQKRVRGAAAKIDTLVIEEMPPMPKRLVECSPNLSTPPPDPWAQIDRERVRIYSKLPSWMDLQVKTIVALQRCGKQKKEECAALRNHIHGPLREHMIQTLAQNLPYN